VTGGPIDVGAAGVGAGAGAGAEGNDPGRAGNPCIPLRIVLDGPVGAGLAGCGFLSASAAAAPLTENPDDRPEEAGGRSSLLDEGREGIPDPSAISFRGDTGILLNYQLTISQCW
jgi:hypothetical protein